MTNNTKLAEDWKLVPVEPTGEMMNAGLYQSSRDSTYADVHSIWKDMCAFAPISPDAAPAQPPIGDESCKCRRLGDWNGAHHMLCDDYVAPNVRDVPACNCNANPHAENCPVTGHVRALFSASCESASAAPIGDVPAAAWSYELATVIGKDGTYSGWRPTLSGHKPNVPKASIRNLRPLAYAEVHHAAPIGDVQLSDEVIRMLEGYAESYDSMWRMDGGGNKVGCNSVAFDIRNNMIGWIKKRALSAPRERQQPEALYTMDQMREYADAFHRSRQEPARVLTTVEIYQIWDSMPGGGAGFRKEWGYEQFARAVARALSSPAPQEQTK